MEAYCLKCKTKREMQEAVAGFTVNGAPITKGVCSVCGTKLSKMGNTPAHEGLERPVIEKTEKPVRKTAKPRKSAAKTGTGKGKNTRTSRGTKGTKVREQKPVVYGKGKSLVVVESPAKARTIAKFLGDKYRVVASVGHVRDLLKTQLSVDVDNDFTPKYRVPDEKKAIVAQIKDLSERSDKIYLATDPDREGESIAWHIQDAAEINPKKTQRVVFHEITQPAVAEAFSKTRELDMDLVDAQQARRILDRLVGFGISPILWAKVRGRLSAGRVQSVALRLIVERERLIQDFVPQEYWTVYAIFQPEGSQQSYKARLISINKKDLELNDEAVTRALVERLYKADYLLDRIRRSQRSVRPSAPFITSTLQQEASRRLGYLTSKTMAVAQQLYEGIDLGNGEEVGLITYMRTDSVHVSGQAVSEARAYIARKYGETYLPEKAPVYRTRAANAQEAHEAIRPTSAFREPEGLRKHLSADQYKLYKLVWQRFMASQMAPARLETLTVEVKGSLQKETYLFRAQGTKTLFPGFKAVYEDAPNEDQESEEFTDLPIEVMSEGQKQLLKEIESNQRFTQPPPRFTEASLIQVLEENKIGRPSTYSPIITAIQQRGYVTREAKRLVPTEIGFIVNDLVVEYFPTIVDISFTSQMEDELDEIAKGKTGWVGVMDEFYGPFSKSLANAKAHMPKTKLEPEKVGRACPQCGADLVYRTGRFGKFISCSTFPNCRYTEPFLEKIGVRCPDCDDGDVVEKRSKRGRVFYGCSNFPTCEFTSWNKPLTQPCPDCGGVLVQANRSQSRCLTCKHTFPILQEAQA